MKPSSQFVLSLIGVTALGAVLRLYLIGDQILLDDEWHGLQYVLSRPLESVWLDYNAAVNSSRPYNVYRWILLYTIGWSEIALRLPVLVCGILTPPVLAALARRHVGEKAALYFGFLLAASPFLVFYGRFCRSYGLVALLAPLCLLSLVGLLTTGKTRWAVLYVVTSTLAVYSHLTALTVALSMLCGAAVAWSVDRHRAGGARLQVNGWHLAAAGSLVIVLLAIILAPVIEGSARLPVGVGQISISTLSGSLRMLGGTGSTEVGIVMAVFSIAGWIILTRRNGLVGGLCLATVVASILMVVLTHPYQVSHPIVFLRYLMPVVPWFYLFVAVALAALLAELQERWGTQRKGNLLLDVGVVCLLLSLLFLGPWRDVYRRPGNFSNHAAFQGDYRALRWDISENRHIVKGKQIPAGQVPRFYREIADSPEIQSIIEYPFDVANAHNLLWYYQYFHRKRVFVGYVRGDRLVGSIPIEGYLTLAFLLDNVLAQVPAKGTLRFANMIDVLDEKRVRSIGASFLILHKHLHTVQFGIYGRPNFITKFQYPSVPWIRQIYEQSWGAPMYEDAELVVFSIPAPPSSTPSP